MATIRAGACAIVLALGLVMWAIGPEASAVVPQEKKLTTPFVKWAAKKEFIANGPHNPLVVNDRVIVGTDLGELRAYRCSDGALVWTHQHGKRMFHTPCSDGKRVYFSSEGGGVTAVTADAGVKVWSVDLPNFDGPTLALAKKEMVYVGGTDGILYALDSRTGAQRWNSDFMVDFPPDPANFPGERARMRDTKARPSALATDGETLFLSVFDQSRIVAVTASTGARLWPYQTGGWIFGPAAANSKYVFFGSQDKAFYCLEKKTGQKVWRFETKGRIESGALVDETAVYFGSCDGGFYCLNQSDGKQRWRFATDLGKDGRKSAIYSTPVRVGDALHFAAGEGQLYAVDQATGLLKWKIRPSAQSEMYCSPATDGTRYFVVTRPEGQGVGEMSLNAIGLK